MALRALTLNIMADEGPRDARMAMLREELAELEPDILGLQEVVQSDDFDQLDALFGDDERYPHSLFLTHPARAARRPHRLVGNALVSRWPLLEHAIVRLPHSEEPGDGERHAALLARVDAPHGPIPIAVVHLNWRLDHEHVRCRQVVALCDAVRALARDDDLPAIIMGDFNAPPDADSIRYVQGLTPRDGRSVHFRDAWRSVHGAHSTRPGHTWADSNPYARWSLEPQRRLDYIFVEPPDPSVSHAGHVLDCQLVCDRVVDGVAVSDHYGVLATLATGGLAFGENGRPFEAPDD